ncbi:MAG: hypothetical protein ACK55Z_19485, partial [bacterium]
QAAPPPHCPPSPPHHPHHVVEVGNVAVQPLPPEMHLACHQDFATWWQEKVMQPFPLASVHIPFFFIYHLQHWPHLTQVQMLLFQNPGTPPVPLFLCDSHRDWHCLISHHQNQGFPIPP